MLRRNPVLLALLDFPLREDDAGVVAGPESQRRVLAVRIVAPLRRPFLLLGELTLFFTSGLPFGSLTSTGLALPPAEATSRLGIV
jgi:hypothetical protein